MPQPHRLPGRDPACREASSQRYRTESGGWQKLPLVRLSFSILKLDFSMTNNLLTDAPILVVGAGIMGLGIAQVAAQAGHSVMLYDSRIGAVAEALAKLAKNLNAL